jgi:aminoglycoside phosphotransferase family enzyme/predicted kinase
MLAFASARAYASIMMNSAHVESVFSDRADTQRALVSTLLNPVRYPDRVGQVRLIETHISYVLLTGRLAYKIKKAVNFGFLDFSTLELRRRYCEDELRLNRRLAAELYLAVVPVIETPDGPRFGEPGDDGAIEYAVMMVEFPQSALFDRRMAQGDLLAAQIDQLADQVASFHGQAASAPPEDEVGTPATILEQTTENFRQLPATPDDAADAADAARLQRLERWSLNEYARLEAFLARRRNAGFVRECHGDLHLGNIALVNAKPLIFDCIEFNALLRWIDVMSEVAFLSMDLAERGRPDLARRFVNRYLEATGDYAGLSCLPFYQIYRALVRAKVAGLRATQEAPPEARQQLAVRARYLDFAQRASEPPQRQLLLMHGVSGSGKTWVAQAVLEHLGALRLRSDVERKRLRGLPALARSDSAPGRNLYDAKTTRATYRRLEQLAREVLQAGFPVIVDAAFLRRWQRDIFRDLATLLKIPFRILSCHADPDTLRRRLVARQHSASDASEADLAILQGQLHDSDPLSEAEQAVTTRFDSDHDALERLLSRPEFKAA